MTIGGIDLVWCVATGGIDWLTGLTGRVGGTLMGVRRNLGSSLLLYRREIHAGRNWTRLGGLACLALPGKEKLWLAGKRGVRSKWQAPDSPETPWQATERRADRLEIGKFGIVGCGGLEDKMACRSQI